MCACAVAAIDLTAAAGISTADFIAKNPGVGEDCLSLWADSYVCVDATGQQGSYDDSASPLVNAAVPTPTSTITASGVLSGSASGVVSGSAVPPPQPAFGRLSGFPSAASASASVRQALL